MSIKHTDPHLGAIATVAEVESARSQNGELYCEFLKVPAMSAGLYVLGPGTQDPQSPHAEDELYYVIDGYGAVEVAGTDHAVGPGSLVFVPAQVAHRFHRIAEELRVLVFFAPAEGSVLATTMMKSALAALEMKVFWPLST